MINYLYKLILSSILLIASMAAYAGSVTEKSVLDSVSDHYPLIKAATVNIAKAKAEYLSAQGAFDPVIRSNMLISPNGIYKNGLLTTDVYVPITDSGNRFFTGYRIGRGTYPPYDQDRETYNYGEVRVGFEIPFMRDRDIDSRRANIYQAKINERISRVDLNLEKLQTNLDASIAYWNWAAEGKRLMIQKHMLALALNRQQAFEKSVDVGDMPAIDAVDNKRIIMQRQAMVKMSEAVFYKASLLLSLYYRDASGKPIRLSTNDLPSVLKEENHGLNPYKNHFVTKDIINKHPEIKLFNQQQDFTQVSLKQASNILRPAVNNRFYVAQDMGGGNPPLNRTTINYELSFELPLNRREAKGQIASAEKSLEEIDQKRRLRAEQIKVGIQQALLQMQANHKVISYTRDETRMAAQVEKAENTRFVHGDSNLFVLNQRELSTAEAELRYVDAIRDYNNAVANLRFSLGRV